MMLLQQPSKQTLYKQFSFKLKNIDQIARLAIQIKQKKITQKYGNIQSTAKLLKGLIIQFTKKSLKLEQDLRQTARIEDLQYQTTYHKNRLNMCLKLSQNLQNLIASKKSQIQKYQTQSKKVKQQLILAKTQNIKKILKIEMLEHLEQQKIEKQNKLKKTYVFQQKMKQNRNLIQTGLSFKPSIIDLLKKEKLELSTLLWRKIDKKLTISKCILDNYQILKQKLVKQQKKSNTYGLAGSLIFRLQQNKQSSMKLMAPGRKNKSDHKLLIYDALRQKYTKQIKKQKQTQNQIKINLEQFLNFTPIQILGLIELKGGIYHLRNNKKKALFTQIKSNFQITDYVKPKQKTQTKQKSYMKVYLNKNQNNNQIYL